jgi:hypothetical protein
MLFAELMGKADGPGMNQAVWLEITSPGGGAGGGGGGGGRAGGGGADMSQQSYPSFLLQGSKQLNANLSFKKIVLTGPPLIETLVNSVTQSKNRFVKKKLLAKGNFGYSVSILEVYMKFAPAISEFFHLRGKFSPFFYSIIY